MYGIIYSVQLINSTFTLNTAKNEGGVLVISGNTIMIKSCQVNNNRADGDGGAIKIQDFTSL